MKTLFAIILLAIVSCAYAENQTTLDVTGDEFRKEGKTVITTGNVIIKYRGIIITADRADYTELSGQTILYRKSDSGEMEVVGMFVTE